jgi:hypothetical protein
MLVSGCHQAYRATFHLYLQGSKAQCGKNGLDIGGGGENAGSRAKKQK